MNWLPFLHNSRLYEMECVTLDDALARDSAHTTNCEYSDNFRKDE